MAIGDVMPQDPSDQLQSPSPNNSTPVTQELDGDKHEEEDEHHDQVQVKSIDQGGDENDRDNGDAPPHPRVCHNVQRDYPIDNILADIKKGVTTRSRVTNFCKHY
jgi:hypothetical protein